MKRGWRERLKSVGHHSWLDPTTSGHLRANDYTPWDLAAVRSCDLLIGYLECDNQSGIGLAAEIGYAKALGKMIWLVVEPPREHAAFIVQMADWFSTDFEDLVRLLRSLP